MFGIPLTNPMGWVSSPPKCLVCIETTTDITNQDLSVRGAMDAAQTSPHCLDGVSETKSI